MELATSEADIKKMARNMPSSSNEKLQWILKLVGSTTNHCV